ncbi:hypothetical protein [Ornithobacterium rhinotracheale]|uniref:hypothetical protein n=1 Tax=Ornithobacterium rhinotracheale TaxID=28251 RepID=UPI001FF5BE29|nr:hypothetical protein [Ornithobacterium rhinotracheale]MCK0206387.1 hypothetical protein [Ornithobacterium rhinotracheale]
MKKTLLLVSLLPIAIWAQQVTPTGRVGINEDNPKATLEVNISEANKNGNTNEGIIAPQVSKARLAKVTKPEEGTLVYVKKVAGYVGADFKVEKVDDKGYYFYNGTQWIKVVGGSVAVQSLNAGNGLTLSGNEVKLGGTLTEATEVNQDSKELTFKTGQNGKLKVEGSLYINKVYAVPSVDVNSFNGLANTLKPGTNIRNYNGTDVPDYTPEDYMIVLTNEDINGNLKLPSAKANPGRIIYLINGTGSGLGFSAPNYDGTNDEYPYNFTTLATRSGVPFLSTGKTWYPIGR